MCAKNTALSPDCCLVNSIDVTLACEDGYTKLVDLDTVVDVDDEDRVGNSLLQIWELRLGHRAKIFRSARASCTTSGEPTHTPALTQ